MFGLGEGESASLQLLLFRVRVRCGVFGAKNEREVEKKPTKEMQNECEVLCCICASWCDIEMNHSAICDTSALPQ